MFPAAAAVTAALWSTKLLIPVAAGLISMVHGHFLKRLIFEITRSILKKGPSAASASQQRPPPPPSAQSLCWPFSKMVRRINEARCRQL